MPICMGNIRRALLALWSGVRPERPIAFQGHSHREPGLCLGRRDLNRAAMRLGNFRRDVQAKSQSFAKDRASFLGAAGYILYLAAGLMGSAP
jgi:hypothetical protein